jgi:hypothetical protein
VSLNEVCFADEIKSTHPVFTPDFITEGDFIIEDDFAPRQGGFS